jgi:cystathionine beta-lyase/cystathionine gamma-synthase
MLLKKCHGVPRVLTELLLEELRSSFHLHGEGARSYRDWAADGVFRFSIGLEDPDDIIADLEQALG